VGRGIEDLLFVEFLLVESLMQLAYEKKKLIVELRPIEHYEHYYYCGSTRRSEELETQGSNRKASTVRLHDFLANIFVISRFTQSTLPCSRNHSGNVTSWERTIFLFLPFDEIIGKDDERSISIPMNKLNIRKILVATNTYK
jgi:hypothetical protein